MDGRLGIHGDQGLLLDCSIADGKQANPHNLLHKPMAQALCATLQLPDNYFGIRGRMGVNMHPAFVEYWQALGRKALDYCNLDSISVMGDRVFSQLDR